jgi:hypothetical protein
MTLAGNEEQLIYLRSSLRKMQGWQWFDMMA